MPRVAFVFTNPRHHFEMMSPVARQLRTRGIESVFLSLAELRGLDSPTSDDLEIRRVIPFNVRRRTSIGTGWSDVGTRRRFAKRLVWMGLAARMWQLLRSVDAVIVPNDSVFPYTQLVSWLRERGVPYVLIQEGIRFKLPAEYVGPPYGGGGAAAICAWGEGSAEYFAATGIPRDSIVVTGSPRFDDVVPGDWASQGATLRKDLGLDASPVAFVSNPIEIQGYGTKQQKLDLFGRFMDELGPSLDVTAVSVIVKTHAHEDPAEFARVAKQTRAAKHVYVVESASLFATLAASRAAIVLASTVGLEALMFGLPVGVLQIPGHDFAFEYVQRGAAVPFTQGTVETGFRNLLEPTEAMRNRGKALVERHLHDRGRASQHVAEAIMKILPAAIRRGA